MAQGFTQREGVDFTTTCSPVIAALAQREGVDFTTTYSPVIAAPSLQLMLSIAANKGHAVDHFFSERGHRW